MIGSFLNLLDTQTEKEKFIEFYDTYKDLLYWIALKRTNCNEDAEECVQETFFYIAKHFEKINDVNSKKTKIYLSTIVTGFAINIYNHSNRTDIIEIDNENETTDLKYFENFQKIELLSVLNKALDEESRVFFYLKYLYNYKSKEIAEVYKVKDSYVRKKLEYARRKLRKQLEERI
ncbi:MAG: sigma-70 family RNA polymerase sigma factor [Eubacterium sp.]